MDKNEQRRIWDVNRGYKGKSRKWARRRSKKAYRAIQKTGALDIGGNPHFEIDHYVWLATP